MKNAKKQIIDYVESYLSDYYPDQEEGEYTGDIELLAYDIARHSNFIINETEAIKLIKELIDSGELEEDSREWVNPENSQRTICVDIITVRGYVGSSIDSSTAQKQITLTNEYYDWHNTCADEIMALAMNNESIPQNLINEYNQYLEDYDKYGGGGVEYLEKDSDVVKILYHNNPSL